MPRMTSTMTSSINVKPLSCLRITLPSMKLAGPQPDARGPQPSGSRDYHGPQPAAFARSQCLWEWAGLSSTYIHVLTKKDRSVREVTGIKDGAEDVGAGDRENAPDQARVGQHKRLRTLARDFPGARGLAAGVAPVRPLL